MIEIQGAPKNAILSHKKVLESCLYCAVLKYEVLF